MHSTGLSSIPPLLFLLFSFCPLNASAAANTSAMNCGALSGRKSPGGGPAVTILVPNASRKTVHLFWLDSKGEKKSYGTLTPGAARSISSYAGHVWMTADHAGRCVSAFVVTNPPPELDASWKIVEDDGIQFKAYGVVSDEAINRARVIVNQMLINLPEVRSRMKARQFKVEIIGKAQLLTELPDYAGLRGKKTRDGRDYDTGTRGLGGPGLCSVGEENLLCLAKQPYPTEDIMVHEFSHSIKSNLDPGLAQAIDEAYRYKNLR
ncbi:MAG: hypothetical protein HY074_00485 [Deltaproteobacteria bacterium]|nr:hypothetical protein [Deltaproteobacteria bacterium]